MAIKWYKQPDGTWVLWNDDSSDSTPLDSSPAAGVQGMPGTDTSDVAAQMFEQKQGTKDNSSLSEYGFKLNPTTQDRRYVRKALGALKSGDMSDDDKKGLALDLLDQKLFSLTDDGGVYSSFRHLPGGKEGNQQILDMFRDFKDATDQNLTENGLDPSSMSTEEISNFLHKQNVQKYRDANPDMNWDAMEKIMQDVMAKEKQ